MKILGIETSCDETAAAVVENGTQLLSNVVASQMEIHAQYGGVVPEIAARHHIDTIQPVIHRALTEASCTWDDIDAIAVTYGPGLIGSLLVGTLTARTLAAVHTKPLYPVNHVVAHMYANWLVDPAPALPALALIVSGGHTQLVLIKDHEQHILLGQTQDDAVGEAFDKVAKVIGLPYPGGPSITKAAVHGDPKAFTFTKPKTANPLDFSFSGLKTAVLRAAQKAAGGDHTLPSYEVAARLTAQQKHDLAASFQATAVAILIDRLRLANDEYSPASILIAGGVAANSSLREAIKYHFGDRAHYAPMALCTDNAAMIAAYGYFYAQSNKPTPYTEVTTEPSLSM